MPAGQKGPLSQLMMGRYRCGDGNYIDIGMFIKIIYIIEKFRLGIIPTGFFQPISRSIANGDKLQIRIDIEITSKVWAPVTVSDETYFYHNITPLEIFYENLVY
jgi:hypothetical protein